MEAVHEGGEALIGLARHAAALEQREVDARIQIEQQAPEFRLPVERVEVAQAAGS
jgi:hypothetical protein